MFIGHIRAGHIAHGEGYTIYSAMWPNKSVIPSTIMRGENPLRPRAHSRTDGAFLIYPQVTPESGEG